MGAVAIKTIAGLRHRRLQAIAIGLVLFLASVAGTLALDVLMESHAPFDRAFAAASGAHLVIDFDASVTPAQLAATRHAGPVTASAGPWPVVRGMIRDPKGGFFGGDVVSGRPRPDPSIDDIVPTAGRWWQAPGEAVIDQSTARLLHKGVGDTIDVAPMPAASKAQSGGVEGAAPGPPGGQFNGPATTLTIVGIAKSVSTPQVAVWVSPSDVQTLAAGSAPLQEVLYRVAPAATAADLAAATTAIIAGLEPHAAAGVQNYLDIKAGVDRQADLYVPVLLAFSLFALLAAAFSITNMVSGIVLSSYREIGVMKAIGFTPAQVTRILAGQILVPVTIGTAAGALVGSLASLPILADTAASFGLPAASVISLPAVATVFGIAVATAALAVIGPAIRAGRLSPPEAMSRGASRGGRRIGGELRRLGMALPVGLPLRLGLSSAMRHPWRAMMTLGALVVGVTAITFTIGLNASLLRVKGQLDRSTASPIRVEVRNATSSTSDVTATIAAQPGTAKLVTIGDADVEVPGVGSVPFVGYHADATWIGYELIQGRWFSGPGEAVAPTNFFTVTGLHVGDSTTISAGSRSVTVRLVGETFEQAREARDDLVLRGEWTDLATLTPALQPDRWEIRPTDGVDTHGYWSSLQAALGQRAQASVEGQSSIDASFLLFLTVVGILGGVLITISVGGVFNTVLLETRQRTREMAILKAIGLTPGQVVSMVVASIVPIGLVAGLIGVPLGITAQHIVLSYMGHVAIKSGIPASTFDVFSAVLLPGLGVSGWAIGVAGAYLPALRAARARIAPVLQAE